MVGSKNPQIRVRSDVLLANFQPIASWLTIYFQARVFTSVPFLKSLFRKANGIRSSDANWLASVSFIEVESYEDVLSSEHVVLKSKCPISCAIENLFRCQL